MAVKQAALTALASLLLLSLTASISMAAPARSAALNNLNAIQSLSGVRAAPGHLVHASAVDGNQVAVDTSSRTSDDGDKKCVYACGVACYKKNDEVCCKKFRGKFCLKNNSWTSVRTAVEPRMEAAEMDEDQTAISPIFRTSTNSDSECHKAFILACYKEGDKKLCFGAKVKVCGAQCSASTSRAAILPPVAATGDDNQV